MLSELKPRPPINPAARGYGAIYHEGQVNHCPGCGMTHWYIGLSTAECAFCFTALPLTNPSTKGFTGHAGRNGRN